MFANPYVLLAVGLALAASHGAVGWKAYQVGQDNIIATQAKEASIEERTRAAALEVMSEEISKIEVRNVTIRQKAETITREVPVYRDCRHDPDGLRLINEALRSGSESTDRRELPRTGAAGG